MGNKRFYMYECNMTIRRDFPWQILPDEHFECQRGGQLNMDFHVDESDCLSIRIYEFVLDAFVQLSVVKDGKTKVISKRIQDPSSDELKFKGSYRDCSVVGRIIALEDDPSTKIPRNIPTMNHQLSKRFLDETFSDVTIQVDTQKLPAHLIILTSGSPVFAAMFDHDTFEKQNSLMIIKDFDVDVVKEMLYYLYKSDFHENLEWQVVSSLHMMAEKYFILELKELCKERLMSLTTLDNVVDMLIFAESNSEELKVFCLAFICFYQSDLIQLDSFISSPKNHPAVFTNIFEYF